MAALNVAVTYVLTLLWPLIGGGNLLISRKEPGNQFFSKNYTNILKGLCCIIVVYVHIGPDWGNGVQDAIGSFAYVCVTIFFLISAYGMMAGLERKENYLKSFWINRLSSLLIPCVLINFVSVGLYQVVGKDITLTLLYHIDSYVVVLLEWCIWFFVVEICRKRWFPNQEKLTDFLLITGILLSSLCMYFFVDAEVSAENGWPFERMGLVWGILLYRYFDRFVEWMGRSRLTKIIVLFVLGLILGAAYLKFKVVYFWGAYLLKIILGLVLIMLLFTMTSNYKFDNRLNLWLGDISYEVYLSHHTALACLAILLPRGFNSGAFVFFTISITLIISTLVHAIDKPIVNRIRLK